MVEIHRFETADELAHGAADFILSRGRSAQAGGGPFSIALSGGSTPEATYRALAEPDRMAGLDWARVRILWGDERCVPPSDPASNYRMARESLLDHLPVPEDNVFRMACEGDPEQGARAYEAALRKLFEGVSLPRLDLVLLGLGPDGHTASLFPGTTALESHGRWVLANHVEKMGVWRMTLSMDVINAAAAVVFIVQGGAKAEILRRVLEPSAKESLLPAQRVHPGRGEVHWFVDDAAGALLSNVS